MGDDETTKNGSTVVGDLDVNLPSDVDSVENFRTNLKIGAIFVSKDCPFPLRSRIRLILHGSEKDEAAKILVDVVFVQPGNVGLEVRELTSRNQVRLDRLLDHLPVQTPAPEPESRTSPPPETLKAPPPPAATPKPTPTKVPPVPLEGTLPLHLPSAIQRMYRLAENRGWQERNRTLWGSTPGFVFQIHSERFVGRLTFTDEAETTTRIYFNDGAIVAVHRYPIDETETIAFLLRKAGKLTGTEYQEVRTKRDESGLSDEKILYGQMNTRELAKTGRRAMYHHLGLCFATRELRYKLDPGASFLQDIVSIPVSMRRALFRGTMEAAAIYRMDELLEGLESIMNFYVARHDPFPFDPTKLNLSNAERRFLDVTLAKPIRLRKMFSMSALSKIQSVRVIYAFYFLGFIDFLRQYQPPEAEVLAHIEATSLEVAQMNHFDVLHVHWAALGPEIKSSYERLKKEWKEIRIPDGARAKVTPLVGKIQKQIDDSYAFLKENDQRRSHRNEMIDATRRQQSAELLAQHAKADLLREDYRQARYYVEQAIDLAPGNQEYLQLRRDCDRKGR